MSLHIDDSLLVALYLSQFCWACGWLSQSSVCLQLRSQSRGPGTEPCIGCPARCSLLLPLPACAFSHILSLFKSISLEYKILNKFMLLHCLLAQNVIIRAVLVAQWLSAFGPGLGPGSRIKSHIGLPMGSLLLPLSVSASLFLSLMNK